MSLPDLESLRCFEAAADQLSFRIAATAVGLSPTAFSDRIKRLEEQLDARLFERTTRKVWLTDAGRRLLEHARPLLAQARACEEVVRDDAPVPVTLTIGTRFELGLSWLVPSLQPLKDRAPHRTLHVHFGNGPDLMQRVLTGTVDAIIASIRFAEPQVAYARLHEEAYVFVARPDVLTRAPLEGPHDAGAHVLLDTEGSLPLFRYFLDAARSDEVWSFAGRELLGTIGAIRYRLLEGAGVAVLPRYFVQPDLDTGDLVELLGEVQMRTDWFRLIWRAGHPDEEHLIALAEDLRALPLK